MLSLSAGTPLLYIHIRSVQSLEHPTGTVVQGAAVDVNELEAPITLNNNTKTELLAGLLSRSGTSFVSELYIV